jgi:hypothetical protein
VVLVLYRTGAVVTPALHVGTVLDVLHQMRTPKLHAHHDKNPEKKQIPSITNNKTIMNALTFETGTDGDEKRRRGGGKRLCSAVQTESYHMAVMILFCTALVRRHSTRKNSRVDFYAS